MLSDTEMLVLDEKDAGYWVYRGEGAANIVLSYTGSSPLFVGKVLRLQKALKDKAKNDSSCFSEHERLLWSCYGEIVSAPSKEIAGRLFVQHVMSPLLGAKHVDAGIQVHASKKFLLGIEKKIESSRPSWRISASKVDTHCESVLVISDHSLFPSGNHNEDICISVEIKPKCGFLPSSRYVSKRNAIKRRDTRFRMHQVLKFHNHEIEDLSDYDPLDLFSGSQERICRALKALFDHPQNNLRVFLNGSLVLGGLGGIASPTSASTEEAVEDMLKLIIQANDNSNTECFIELLAETISKSGVLRRLLDAQKLDNYDIEGAVHAYYNIISEPCPVCRELDRGNESSEQWSDLHSISLDESLEIVRNFLTAATAKDCSLMFCLKQENDGEMHIPRETVYLKSTNQVFAYKAFFIDLDMKPLEKMEYYYELDQKIVRRYIEAMHSENAAGSDIVLQM